MRGLIERAHMRRKLAIALIGVPALPIPVGPDEEPLQAFTRASLPAERDWEIKFRTTPSPDDERQYLASLLWPYRRIALTFC